jgi:Mannosyl-glycoprotein endo-beta-N-acetylglucosaminidase
MASGSSYAKKLGLRQTTQNQLQIPPRATRPLEEAVAIEEDERETGPLQATFDKALQLVRPAEKLTTVVHVSRVVVDQFRPDPLARHKSWLKPLIISFLCVIIGSIVLLSAAITQRPSEGLYLNFFGGKAYNVQVGGDLAGSWEQNGPQPTKVAIPSHPGPYSVLGQPTITPDFINQVLAAYHSPAAGKGQTLYDMGVKYGIDPAFALAFFMHESTFGNAGEARLSLSLGNLRCIPNFKCQDGYAWFNSWEDGFEAWYKLIRNLYVAIWGLTTVDQIIPRYAPTSDNNNEAAYIAALKRAIDTWHAGQIYV